MISQNAIISAPVSYTHLNYTYAKTFEFLHILEKYYIEPITESDPDACDASIFALKNFFNEHYMDNFSLSDVAAEFNYTPPYLSSLIKKKLHITFQEYITCLLYTSRCV